MSKDGSESNRGLAEEDDEGWDAEQGDDEDDDVYGYDDLDDNPYATGGGRSSGGRQAEADEGEWGSMYGGEDAAVGPQALLDEEIAEVQAAGYLAGFDVNRIECVCWVGFPLRLLRPDVLFASGLEADKSVAIKLVFTDPPLYGSHCPSVKERRIVIRQTAKQDFSKLSMTDCETFGLWWTLEQRLGEYLQASWSEVVTKQTQALERLRERERQVSTQHVRALMEIHSCSRDVAYLCLLQSGNHLDKATDVLFDEERRRQLERDARPAGRPAATNLLFSAVQYVQQRIEVCTRYCIVCDKPHPLQLLKPVVCPQPLCNFQFTNLGLGISIETEILRSPEACDLLISMTAAAAISARHFEPFPSVEGRGDAQDVSFDRTRPREIWEVLQRCPGVRVLADYVRRGRLQEELDGVHPLLYKLLRWIIGTNRAHLHYIVDAGNRVEGVHSDHQFVLKSTPPEKERVFKQHKEDCRGSFYAFHGSSLCNWHSILRLGLRNYSGTEKQSHGAVYGPGIYMAVDGSTAFEYAGSGNSVGWNNSMFSAHVKCVALCEVVNYGEADGKKCIGKLHRPKCKHSTNSPHYRVEAEDLVVTRYLLIYSGAANLNGVLAKDLRVPHV